MELSIMMYYDDNVYRLMIFVPLKKTSKFVGMIK